MIGAHAKETIRQPRWLFAFFILAAFDLLTVCGSLFLGHTSRDSYRQAVEANRAWSEQIGNLSTLGALAQTVNAPGNDIFDSRNVALELERRDLALLQFDAQMADVLSYEAEWRGEATAIKAAVLRSQTAMDNMNAEANLIFQHFERGNSRAAGRRMATMDRKYAELTRAVADTVQAVQAQQLQVQDDQLANAEDLGLFEYIIAGLILIMIAAASGYSYLLNRFWKCTAQLDQQRLAAEAANAEKTMFLAKMSHELRTPLSSIIGYTEAIQEEIDALQQPQVAEDLTIVRAAAEHLLNLINEVLDWAKVNSGKLELQIEELNPSAIAEEIVALMQPAARANNSTLALLPGAGELIIRNDSFRIRQCLLNLVSNACKFTYEGKVEIAIESVVGANGPVVVFHISDTGAGISELQLARIFQPYLQADASVVRKHGGTGLGLPITKQLALLLGGDLNVQSTLGAGSCFSLSVSSDIAGAKSAATIPLELQQAA